MEPLREILNSTLDGHTTIMGYWDALTAHPSCEYYGAVFSYQGIAEINTPKESRH